MAEAPARGGAVALGFRALKGGSAVVGVALDAGEPRLALSSFLATAAAGDRLSLEPYHVAAEIAGGAPGVAFAEIEAAVAQGRRRQDALAAEGLAKMVDALRAAGGEPVVAALLVNRAGWVSDLLRYSIAYPDHPPVAEGLAVRDAIRFACGRAALDVVETDEKSLPALASDRLGLEAPAIEARLSALGAAAGRPWRKEQKLACLAAWAALAGRR